MSVSEADAGVLERTKLKPPAKWTVVLHNDDYTPINFVISVLVEIFHLSIEEAEVITMRVHNEGRSPVGNFSKEIAQTKAYTTTKLAEEHQHPLLATAEEL
jgi:ATP-dependent Clp protease adaptor protein ClpS